MYLHERVHRIGRCTLSETNCSLYSSTTYINYYVQVGEKRRGAVAGIVRGMSLDKEGEGTSISTPSGRTSYGIHYGPLWKRHLGQRATRWRRFVTKLVEREEGPRGT